MDKQYPEKENYLHTLAGKLFQTSNRFLAEDKPLRARYFYDKFKTAAMGQWPNITELDKRMMGVK